jgi:hypothetical protein
MIDYFVVSAAVRVGSYQLQRAIKNMMPTQASYKPQVLLLHHLKHLLLTNTPKLSRMFFVMFLIVIVVQIVDTIIGSLADVLKDFTVSFWG